MPCNGCHDGCEHSAEYCKMHNPEKLCECVRCNELVKEDDGRECYYCGDWKCDECAQWSELDIPGKPACRKCINEADPHVCDRCGGTFDPDTEGGTCLNCDAHLCDECANWMCDNKGMVLCSDCFFAA